MSALLGLDPAEVRRLSRSLEAGAEELDWIRTQVSQRTHGLAWHGADAQRLLRRWDQQDVPVFKTVAAALRDAAHVAKANADEQERASEAGGGGAGGGSGDGSSGGGGFTGWLADRVDDVGGWVGDRLEAINDDTLNMWEAAAQLWDATGGALLDGETPRMTEVLASGIQLSGAATGSLITTATLGMFEANVFDDGHATVTGVDLVDGRVPSNLKSVMESVTDAYGDDGTVRITMVDGPDGPRAIVAIPGTETWNPLAGENAADVTGNLVTAGGGRSTWSEGVALAIEAANLPPGTEVLLAGHSQGGMTAADLASDPEFVSKYHVTDVLTYGSPIDSEHIDPSVNVLEVQHSGDVVPKLDLGDLRVDGTSGAPQDSGHHTTVTLDNPDNPGWSYIGPLAYAVGEVLSNHDYDEYAQSVGSSADPGIAGYEAQLRESGFLTDDAGRVTTLEVAVARED